MPPVLRNLSASELTGPEVRELLRLATDFDDGALDRLVSEVLPRLTVLAAMDDDAGRTPSPWPPTRLRAARRFESLKQDPRSRGHRPRRPSSTSPRPPRTSGPVPRERSSRRSVAATRAPSCGRALMTMRSASTAHWASSIILPRGTRAGRRGGATTASSTSSTHS